jgi:osmotically-inducible protein OsmY
MTHTRKSDEQIQRIVLDELKWNPRVKATEVAVQVRDGTVTLTGTVDSWAARSAAQEAAHRVDGVLDVANEVQVRASGSHRRTDTEIAQAVRHALEWDVFVPDQQIRTTVADGVVTLEGRVRLWTEFDDAGRCVHNLAGVRELRNLIEVEPEPVVSAHVVKMAIENALQRHAAHAARHVSVSIQNGKVVLTGEVPSWGEYGAVSGAVRGTAGVKDIENRIRVHP